MSRLVRRITPASPRLRSVGTLGRMRRRVDKFGVLLVAGAALALGWSLRPGSDANTGDAVPAEYAGGATTAPPPSGSVPGTAETATVPGAGGSSTTDPSATSTTAVSSAASTTATATSTTTAPADAASGPTIAIIGDATIGGGAAGTGDATSATGAGLAGLLLGAMRPTAASGPEPDVQVVRLDGGGYGTAGPTGARFSDAADQIVTADTDVVILVGGTNDALLPADLLDAAVNGTLDRITALAPSSQVVIVGPTRADGAFGSAVLAVRDDLVAQATTHHAVFLDPIAEGWFPATDTNLLRRDGTPTAAGLQVLAARIGARVQQGFTGA